MSAAAIFIQDFSVACALGDDAQAVAENLFAPSPPLLCEAATLSDGRTTPVGRVSTLAGPAHETRTNRIIAHAYAPLAPAIEAARARHGAKRIGIVIGTSVSGIGEGGEAVRARLAGGPWPPHFTLERQQLGDARASRRNRRRGRARLCCFHRLHIRRARWFRLRGCCGRICATW